MTTADQILTRARYPMRDAAEEMFTDAELLDLLNEAIADLASRQRLVREVSGTINPDANGALAIPADVINVRWAKNPDGVEVSWMDESVFFDYQATFPNWSADSPLATTYDDKVWIHPKPATTEAWTIGYYGVPAALTAVGDTFPLRRTWEAKAVAYLQWRMYQRLDEAGLAREMKSFYEEGLRPADSPTDHQTPGRLNLSREGNVFDNDPDSIHLGA